MHTKRILGLIIITGLMVVASGCKKDKEEPLPTPPVNTGGGNTTPGTMSATIGNNSYSSDQATARFRTNGELTIRATDEEEKSFFFVINNFSGTLTYAMNPGSPNSAAYEYNFGGQNIHFSTTNGVGQFTITEYNQSEQLLSGSFSFTAGQTGSPENIIEVVDGEFTNIPITTLQQPANGEAVFYHNDKLYYADSIKVFMTPPYLVEVALYHESTGWVRTLRPLRNYPDYNQTLNGYVWGFSSVYLESTFYSEYSLESETIVQSMKLLDHLVGGVYDFEYFLGVNSVYIPYTTESETVKIWSDLSPLNNIQFTDAYLSPDENGNYELTATNDNSETLTITTISNYPIGMFGNHSAVVTIEIDLGIFQFIGDCFWQESELGSGHSSIEFAGAEFQMGAPLIVAKDIPIVE